jgi:hypothetical protein
MVTMFQTKLKSVFSLSWLLTFIFGKTLFAWDALGERGGGEGKGGEGRGKGGRGGEEGRVIKKGVRD